MLALLLALLAPQDLRLESVRESLTGTHCRYRLYVDSLPTDDTIVRPCDALQTTMQSSIASRDRIVNGRRVHRTIVYDAPLEPWAEDVDATTGQIVRRIPLFHRATKAARVFDPNPVVTLNAPSLQDRNDAATAVPANAYRDVQLRDVAESGALRGPWVSLVDRQQPTIAPPDAVGSLQFDREQDGFEDVSAYFHIDRDQRYVQSLGYTGSRAIAAYPIEVDAHATSGTDNSFFLPSLSQVGHGTLYFGEGGTDDAEDADLLIHEYGHALLEWIAPGTFGGPFASEARALGEGFGDYWAFSAHRDARLASGRDPYCFADWDARCSDDDPSQNCAYGPGSDCLRRLDSTRTMTSYDRTDRAGVEHLNGAIWSSALREIHEALGRETTNTIVLESIFDVPAQPSFASVARLMLRADQLLYGGEHAATICAAMTKRGILAECGSEPRGELTIHQSTDRNIAIADLATITSSINITDARTIERVLVRVDLEHASRGDLRIELVAPDGTTVLLQAVSIDRGVDLHTTFGLTATPVESLDVLRGRGAAGTWQLRVTDQRSRDAGTLLSWSLQLQLAGDTRAQARPRAERTQMIPVVAHIFGANDTTFRSDVRLANPFVVPGSATLIFTPSGRDGTATFSAINVMLNAGQTLAFDDVVESVFATAGSGSLEILGDVVAMSRTYTMYDGGTVGQQIPPARDTTAPPELPYTVASIDDPNTRVNLGMTETGGAAADVIVGTQHYLLAPFSHVQFRVPRGTYQLLAPPRVTAYLSQIDNTTGDAMFIPARRAGASVGLAPVIARQGADRQWRSDLWYSQHDIAHALPVDAIAEGRVTSTLVRPAPGSTTYIDVLARLYGSAVTFAALRVPMYPGLFAATRVATDGMSEFVPLRYGPAPVEQQLVFIETRVPYRTNVGFVSETAATAEVVIVDAAGTELDRFLLSTAGGVAQTSIAHAVSNGRAIVRFMTGGSGYAYASLIDGRSGDATFVEGQ